CRISGVLRPTSTAACCIRSKGFTMIPRSKSVRGATDIIERLEYPLIERSPVEQRIGFHLHARRKPAFLSVDADVFVVAPADPAVEWTFPVEGRCPGSQRFHFVRSQGGPRNAEYSTPIFTELLIGKCTVS